MRYSSKRNDPEKEKCGADESSVPAGAAETACSTYLLILPACVGASGGSFGKLAGGRGSNEGAGVGSNTGQAAVQTRPGGQTDAGHSWIAACTRQSRCRLSNRVERAGRQTRGVVRAHQNRRFEYRLFRNMIGRSERAMAVVQPRQSSVPAHQNTSTSEAPGTPLVDKRARTTASISGIDPGSSHQSDPPSINNASPCRKQHRLERILLWQIKHSSARLSERL